MEITCKRCYTEYDFDDALVSERGTTVRCTQCGEQFRVFRPPSLRPERWVINRTDGRELVFTNLRDLQRAILNVQVGRRDMLTHDGEPPRPLGSIEELKPFFAERPGSTPPPPPVVGADTQRLGTEVRQEVIAARTGRTLRPPPDGPPTPPPPIARELQSYAADEEMYPRPRAADPAAPRADRRSSVPPSEEPAAEEAYGAEQEWFAEPRFTSVAPQRSRAVRWLVVLMLLGVIGIGIAALGRKYGQFSFRPAATTTPAEARVDILVEEAGRALGEGDVETAREAFDKASALADRDPRVLTGLARVEAVRADTDWLKVRLLPSEPADVVVAARRQAEQSAARVQRAADRAASLAPDDPTVVRSKIDALRLAGDLSNARALVPLVTSIAAQPETTYVLAALDLAEASPNWPAVVERLKAAAAGQPNALGPRAALVYALVRSGDNSLAHAELEKISGSAHPYPLLPELSAFANRSTNGGATAPPRAETAKREAPPVVAPPPARRAPEPRAEPESGATDFRILLERASQATATRQYDRAEQLYRMALVKNPGDTEALGGLGDVARARGNSGLARTYYEQVLSRNPHYLPSLAALADLDWESGDKASAVKRYAEIVAITPTGPLAERAKNRIAEASDARPAKTDLKPAAPAPSAEKAPPPAPPSTDLPPGVDTSDLPGFHR
jgi:predicted Zn finger-like uncharacterized protein